MIITGATGMVGEGVLFECLEHPDIKRVLMVNRRHYEAKHSKLEECIVPDFLKLDEVLDQLSGYDACFYCAGVSSWGMKEPEYTHITYDITMHFAQSLASLNPGMIFNYVSGSFTDSSEKGKIMWARVKGRTENALMRLRFKKVYNFRPAFMKPTAGQRNIKPYYKFSAVFYPLMRLLFPGRTCTMRDVGQAMINSVLNSYSKQILEVNDIRLLAITL